jgi:TusA-related sulfurtransferase
LKRQGDTAVIGPKRALSNERQKINMTITGLEKNSASNQSVELMPGTLAGIIDWHILDQVFSIIQHSNDSNWRLCSNDTPLPGENRSKVVDASGDLVTFLIALNAYLRESHPRNYCGLVFTDSLTEPKLIRIFDPKFLTSMCNIYGNTPAPSWVITTMDAAQLAASEKSSPKFQNHSLGKHLPPAPKHPQISDSLDARRMGCPLPLIHTARSLRRLVVGEILEIITIDPGSVNDIEYLCKSTGAKHLALAEGEYGYSYYVERGPSRKSDHEILASQ